MSEYLSSTCCTFSISKFEDILRIMMEINKLFQGIENPYIFNNQTTRIGFVVACAEKIFGLLGNGDEKDHLKVSDLALNNNLKNIFTLNIKKNRFIT